MLNRLNLAAAAVLIVGGLGMASGANAAPIGSGLAGLSGDSLVTHVAQGCGRGFHRGPNGRCRPGLGRRVYGAPRPFLRRCFVRPTPFGPRRVCR